MADQTPPATSTLAWPGLNNWIAQYFAQMGQGIPPAAAGGGADPSSAAPMAAMAAAQRSGPATPAPSAGGDPGNAACYAPGVSARDNRYLSQYYAPVAAKAADYGVDPTLVLGNGIESTFASGGTYNKTNDAFGLTNGDPNRMTYTPTPQDDVNKLFSLYGNQIRGLGSDRSAYVNALEGQDKNGSSTPGWKVYNSYDPTKWREMENNGIDQMQRDVPLYVNACVTPKKK